MGTYTPNYGLYKPNIGEKGWGDEVNQNFDIIDSEIYRNRSDIDDILNNKIPAIQTDIAVNKTQIQRIKTEILTIALNVMMNKALLNAETKDFYSIIADVITDEYPYGFKNTFETLPTGVKFDNDGGGTWTKAIKITLATPPSEYAQYRIVIQSNTMQIYSADGTLKADYGASTGVASDFWNNVKSDGSDIRIADQNYSQLYFWIEEFDYANKKAVIWVKIPANTTELYIVYGNADALPSAYNSGENTFEFFDDFEGSELDSTKWQTFGTFDILEVTNGELHAKATQGNALVVSKSTLSRNIVIEDRARLISREIAQAYLAQDINNWFISTYYYYNGWNQKIVKVINGSATDLAKDTKTLSYNTYYFRRTILKESDIIYELYDDNGNLITTLTASDTTFSSGYVGFRTVGSSDKPSEFYVDWIRVLKLADPAEFGDAEVITLTTTGDFITVTFDFPEGVDKLLITADTDAQAIYYSTDDGQTWNAIEPDTETPLPETAYSIKWKFEFATYVRGYAFITW